MKYLFAVCVLGLTVGCTTLSVHAGEAQKKDQALLVLDAAHDFNTTLKTIQNAGKTVEFHLRNGKSFKGMVSELGDHYVVLGKLAGREFFSAKIRLDAIDAIEVQK